MFLDLSSFLNQHPVQFVLHSLQTQIVKFLLMFFLILLVLRLLESVIENYKIQQAKPSNKTLLREFFLCISSLVFFSPVYFAFIYLAQHGFYHLYEPWNQFGAGYFIFSIFVLLAAHETYHYWYHRFLHNNNWFYRNVHMVHHRSANPTVLSTYAFHPIEAMLHPLVGIFVPLIMPLNLDAIFIALAIAEVVNILGHHGYEWFPKWFAEHPFMRHMNRSTFHNLHHSRGGRKNFGYYTTIWDELMGTHHKDSEKLFAEVVSHRQPIISNKESASA